MLDPIHATTPKNVKKNELTKKEYYYEFDRLHQEIIELIGNLKKEIPDINNIYYYQLRKDPKKNQQQDAKSVLSKEFKIMKEAKAVILICPNSKLFSSGWVQIGWAMSFNKPIFVIHREDEDLPFILREIVSFDKTHRRRINYQQGLSNVIGWLKNLNTDFKYFSSNLT